MNKNHSKTRSLWIATTSDTNYFSLQGECEVDVAILGGGIAGLSAAFFLKEAGATVAVVEAQKIAQGVTGNTTAKITSLHNLIYSHLIKKYGEQTAYLYGEANQSINCDFTRAPA
ncbi:MAG: FAD-binding oxidoreductase [Parachlamydiaceae bacterium]|nr:FAD-binding oxidoreductase [Parachlamydiaceae bacterium]